MNMPIGKLFFFVPKTSGRDHFQLNGPGLPQQDCLFSACAGTVVSSFQEKNLYDIFYNDGLFDASKGQATLNATAGINPVILSGNGETVDMAFGSQPVAADGSVRNLTMCLTGFTNAGAGRLTGPDGNEMDSETFLASLTLTNGGTAILDGNSDSIIAANASIPFRLVAQKYGRGIVDYAGDICTPEGCLLIEADLTHPACVSCSASTFDGYIGAASGAITGMTAAWMTYASLEYATEMGEVSFELDEVVVSVTERKLRATWSPELAQDVSAFHNIDAEAELTALLSEQVAAEIDREILRDLRVGGAWSTRWDYNGWKRTASGGFNAYTQKEWNQTLITKVNQISAQIHKATLRGGANFVVVSSEVSAIFDDLEYFHVSNANPEQDQYNMGIEKVGSLGGRYTVYRDPYAPANSIIIGHKGKSLLDTGYIYAPYVPLQLTPTLQNPFNFAPTKGIMTRYAKKMVNNRFYGTITVDGVVTFDVNELR
jgi:hypothetical protein